MAESSALIETKAAVSEEMAPGISGGVGDRGWSMCRWGLLHVASVGDCNGPWQLHLIKLGEQEVSACPWEVPVTRPCCKGGLAC